MKKRYVLTCMIAFSLLLTGCGNTTGEPDKTIVIDPSVHSVFNDTDGDGYGEFEGFGTSLCWWANRVGYSSTLTDASARAFYNKESGLGFNIGRYNIGGGDLVTKDPQAPKWTTTEEVDHLTPHADHIRRSDSIVPGYCTDVTAIDLSAHDEAYYDEHFDRADAECGYAWNYDWDADTNQMNVLRKAIEEVRAGGEEMHAEAFSNSPPYFMTVSGCSSGNFDAGQDNLRPDSRRAFAKYLTDVMAHWKETGTVSFASISPMNEPGTSYWGAYSDKQEGCHFDSGESQSAILSAVYDELSLAGMSDVVLAGTDETSIDSASWSYSQLSDDVKNELSRIDTHSYTGSGRKALKTLAEKEGKNLWMSEVDGTFTAGKQAGEMAAALGLSQQIKMDLNGMFPSAWILWDAIDVHIDSTNPYDWHTRKQCLSSIGLDKGNSLWGVLIADHDAGELIYTQKYHALGQYSRYIRPGMCLMASSDFTVAAWDPHEERLVIVATNNNSDDLTWTFDLSGFSGLSNKASVHACRTSGSLESGESWAEVDKRSMKLDTKALSLTAAIKGQSITTFVIDGVYIEK